MRHAVPALDCFIAPDETTAVATALGELTAGDLAVVFYDDFATVSDVLRRFGAVPRTSAPPRLEAAA